MMMSWLQKHRLSLLFFLALLSLIGIFSALKLPVALFPNIAFPRIQLTLSSGDMPADRMVIAITRPLERIIKAVPEVTNIRSFSSRGSAEFSINFTWGTDMTTALLQVEGAVNKILPTLPQGTTFEARRMDPTVFPIMGLALTSQTQDLIALKDVADYQLIPLLSNVPGIASIEALGGAQAEYHVLIDPAKLIERSLTFDELIKTLSVNNQVTAVGKIEDFYQLYLVLANNQLNHLNDIKNSIIRSGNNGLLLLKDVATISKSTTPVWTKVRANGQDAVLINIMQQHGANSLAIAKGVQKQLTQHQQILPKGTTINTYYNQSELVIAAAHSVRDAILIGTFLAAIILYLFLRNLRMTLIIALILPCVLATTTLMLNLLNMSFNIMTLGGMAAAVGLIIDDGVVMLEHIMRRLSEAPQEGHALPITRAAMQMLRPLAGSSLATIVIFLPLAFISGVTGTFFKALALTMAIALISSFIYVFFVVPLLGEKFLNTVKTQQMKGAGACLSKVQHYYKRLMIKTLESKYVIVAVLLSGPALGYLAYSQMGSGFMPQTDEGGFILDYMAPLGTSLSETDRLVRQVEHIIQATPEVDSYSRRTGLQLGGGLTEANTGDIFIHLHPMPRRAISEVMNDIRSQIENKIPGLTVETAQLMEDMIGDLTAVPQPIEIKLFGDNQALLITTANQVAKQLASIDGVVEIKNGVIVSGNAINITVKRAKAAFLGLDPDAIKQQIQTMLEGSIVSQVQSGGKLINVRVWTAEKLRQRIKQLEQLPLRSSSGHLTSLGHVATLNIEQGQAQINRENQKTMVAVTARIDGRDLGSTMNDVKAMMHQITLSSSVYAEFGGLYQEQQKSFFDLLMVFLGALLLVTVLLLFLYEQIAIVLSIIMTTLLSLPGALLGLWLSGVELNISSMMGMTMIVGMVTEIAIFYCSELKLRQHHSKHALIQAGIMRMRPILMTAIIAILTLMPLALDVGSSSTMQKPLAIAIIFGLIFAVPLVLVVMPVFYYHMGKSKLFKQT